MSGNNYREIIGSLQYAALVTRLDIKFTHSKRAQFLTDLPDEFT